MTVTMSAQNHELAFNLSEGNEETKIKKPGFIRKPGGKYLLNLLPGVSVMFCGYACQHRGKI